MGVGWRTHAPSTVGDPPEPPDHRSSDISFGSKATAAEAERPAYSVKKRPTGTERGNGGNTKFRVAEIRPRP